MFHTRLQDVKYLVICVYCLLVDNHIIILLIGPRKKRLMAGLQLRGWHLPAKTVCVKIQVKTSNFISTSQN